MTSNRLSPSAFAGAAVATIDAPEARLDAHEGPAAAWNSGACVTSHAMRRGPDGTLRPDPSSRECYRLAGFRLDEHGNPKAVHEPCNMQANEKEDTMNSSGPSIDDLVNSRAKLDGRPMMRSDATTRTLRTDACNCPAGSVDAVVAAIARRDAWAANAGRPAAARAVRTDAHERPLDPRVAAISYRDAIDGRSTSSTATRPDARDGAGGRELFEIVSAIGERSAAEDRASVEALVAAREAMHERARTAWRR